MVTIRLSGRITENGELEVNLPAGLPPVEVEITLDFPATAEALPEAVRPWTEEEIQAMLQPGTPKTGAEIAARIEREGGGWEDYGITDSNEWLEEQRRKRRERHQW